MNGGKNILSWKKRESISNCIIFLSTISLGFFSGCDNVAQPTEEQIQRFETAGSFHASPSLDRVERAKLQTGPYRVVPGDVLEFVMPSVLQTLASPVVRPAATQREQDKSMVCRVGLRGTITLPAIGEVEVQGKTLTEIEELVIKAYHAHTIERPPIFIRILEYQMQKVYIAGIVKVPGVHDLKNDEMTLVSLLTKAGGIGEFTATENIRTGGAAHIRIVRAEDHPVEAGQDDSNAEIIVPVIGSEIPLYDIALQDGDTVLVEEAPRPLFSVVGLVQKPGNYDYPPAAEFNLMQAIAYAGGLNMLAEPYYATIYRMDEDGRIVHLPFRMVDNEQFTDAVNTPILPGDLIAIEHTPRTRSNLFFNSVFRFGFGSYYNLND
ncbi:MAG: polysaccharide biosynthesis/export family protein [Sedimentisphaerales bacterium]|nr:polysaccharide biosynthesis/export family protein [Sedimentisphaerales bacterium]